MLALLAASCRDEPPPAPPSAPSASIAPEPAPGAAFVDLARHAALSARDAARKLSEGARGETCAAVEPYAALRRAIARGKPWWRLAAGDVTEVLLGPVRPVTEGGGNLGLLDAARGEGDCSAVRSALFQVEQSLSMLLLALARPIDDTKAVRALCTTAVDLGGVLLESDAEVALEPAFVRADALGTLDGLEEGVSVITGDRPRGPSTDHARSVLAALRRGVEAPDLAGRGALVRQTGHLGASLRLLARERGFTIKPPFEPRVRTAAEPLAEPVSRLTVPAPRSAPDPKRVALGKRLFAEKRLSGAQERACSTCHVPGKAFTDRLPRARSLEPAVVLRNTPTLLYAATQAAQLWDGRVLTHRRQALRVLHSTAEMGVTDGEMVSRISEDPGLSGEFAAAFPDGVTPGNVAAALAEYQESALVPASAPIDRFARGEAALSPAAERGLDVFAGAGRCARCHVPPLFGGTRPNDFAVTVYAALGTPAVRGGRKLSPDRGRFEVTRVATDDGAFKTPTVRNSVRTAPYFHNGAFPSLESVVDFYDKGGGRGHGLTVENQDPDVRPLRLRPEQKADLLVFLREAVTEE